MSKEELIRRIKEKFDGLDEIFPSDDVISAYDLEKIIQREIIDFNEWFEFFKDWLAKLTLLDRVCILDLFFGPNGHEVTSFGLLLKYSKTVFKTRYINATMVKQETQDIKIDVGDSSYWEQTFLSDILWPIDHKVSRIVANAITKEIKGLYKRCKDMFDQAFDGHSYLSSLCRYPQAIRICDLISNGDELMYVINLSPDNTNKSFLCYDPNEENKDLLSMGIEMDLEKLNRSESITKKMPVVISELPEIYQEVVRKHFDGIERGNAQSTLVLEMKSVNS